jgi:glutaminyl-peptide cyclotransferase
LKNANPVSHYAALLLTSTLTLVGCGKADPENRTRVSFSVPPSPAAVAASSSGAVMRYSYVVVKTWPHDRAAFTQGLVFHAGSMIESTGLNGHSTLREVQLETGRVLKQIALAPAYFAEGVAVVGSHAIQLTWQNRKAFVYDVDTFQLQKEFAYEGEGWGLTTDGNSLILSDGTNRIRFIDPATFSVSRTINVTVDKNPRDRLNELEFIHGEIFANVWQTDEIVRIDPVSGNVRGVIDFSGLLPPQNRTPDADVLNGIAYDPKSDRLFVTGKRWPLLFEVRLKAKN